MINTNVTENISDLQGVFEINNKNLVNTGEKGLKFLVIGTRKTPTKTKPINYILSKIGGKFTYVTSMYPTGTTNNYKLEYKGRCYDMVLQENQYVITTTQNCR